MIKTDAKSRSKRLRKKLFVGEFKVLGFAVDMSFDGCKLRFVKSITPPEYACEQVISAGRAGRNDE